MKKYKKAPRSALWNKPCKKTLFIKYSAEIRFLQGLLKSLGVLPRNEEGNPEFPVQFSKKELSRFVSCIFYPELQEDALLHATLLSSRSTGWGIMRHATAYAKTRKFAILPENSYLVGCDIGFRLAVNFPF